MNSPESKFETLLNCNGEDFETSRNFSHNNVTNGRTR